MLYIAKFASEIESIWAQVRNCGNAISHSYISYSGLVYFVVVMHTLIGYGTSLSFCYSIHSASSFELAVKYSKVGISTENKIMIMLSVLKLVSTQRVSK